jgi:hypothetical protein
LALPSDSRTAGMLLLLLLLLPLLQPPVLQGFQLLQLS